jgi:catechol 2,3-dioxygenase-like lactoylglutathione lyase family enzyme
MMTTTAFCLAKIHVRDIDAAERFYQEGLGLRTAARVTNGEGEHAMVELIMNVPGANPSDANFILIAFPNAPCPPPGEATVGFIVTDLDAALERAFAAGATLAVAAADMPQYGLRLAFILDPQGHRVELLQRLDA